MKKRGLLSTVGTRPDAIEMAPVIRALRDARWEVPTLATGIACILARALGYLAEARDPSGVLGRA